MRHKAVIFDLFGTLVDNYPTSSAEGELARMASILHLPEEAFARLWHDTVSQRMTGSFATVEANLEHICRGLEAPVDPARLAAASHVRLERERAWFIPRDDARATLEALRGSGRRIGLISDCWGDVPRLWRESSLAPLVDVPVFS